MGYCDATITTNFYFLINTMESESLDFQICYLKKKQKNKTKQTKTKTKTKARITNTPYESMVKVDYSFSVGQVVWI